MLSRGAGADYVLQLISLKRSEQGKCILDNGRSAKPDAAHTSDYALQRIIASG
jgi:hypothetical protein